MRHGERERPAVAINRPIDRYCGSLTPLVYPQVFAPEAQRKLAGGGAKRNHRSRTKPIWRPGWDAGPRPASMPVLCPIRGAPASVAEFPVVTLRSTTG